MTKIITTITLFICSFVSAQTFNLTVQVSGFKSNVGTVKVGLYNSESTFLKSTCKRMSSAIAKNQAEITFQGIEKGEYAVSLYQDENGNGKLDTNFMGIPKEAYASSNNAKGFMGPPKYQEAKFIVDKNQTITILLD